MSALPGDDVEPFEYKLVATEMGRRFVVQEAVLDDKITQYEIKVKGALISLKFRARLLEKLYYIARESGQNPDWVTGYLSGSIQDHLESLQRIIQMLEEPLL